MHAATAWLSGTDADSRRFLIFLLVSAAGHLILLILLVLVPHISRPDYNSAPIFVDLVMNAAPGPPPGDSLRAAPPEPKKDAAVKEPPVKEPVKPVPEPVKETVKVKEKVKEPPIVPPVEPTVPTFKTKTSMKKETIKAGKVLDDAISKMKDKVDKGQTESYQDALDRLARKVDGIKPDRIGRFGVPGGTGGGGGTGAFGPLEIYKTELIFYIQKNWSYSEQMGGSRKDLEVLIGIKIMPNGEIREIWFDKRSGNQYLDDSAERAIMKSSPLPPLPAGFQGPYLTQGLRFTPSGLQ